MSIIIVNRRYLIGGKWLRFERMIGIKNNLVKTVGYKIAIGIYEIRFYK